MEKDKIKDKNGIELEIGDIIREDIYTEVGKKIGNVIAIIRYIKGEWTKEIIADNGGVGYLFKGERGELKESKHIERIGYNYK